LEKKVKKKTYSITTQKSKVFGIFDDKKVKNIDIDYNRFFPTLSSRITFFLKQNKRNTYVAFKVKSVEEIGTFTLLISIRTRIRIRFFVLT